jgi:hypothetical protein
MPASKVGGRMHGQFVGPLLRPGPVLCDAISVVAEFMIRMLYRPGPVLCDAISVVAEFMVRML